MKTPYLDIGRDGEALSPSALSLRDWPERIPDLHDIPTNADAEHLEMLRRACLHKPGLNEEKLLVDARAAGVVGGVLHILNHRAFQFNSRHAFISAPCWREAVAAACEANRPVALVLPIFCIIANPVKRLDDATTCTLAEMVTLSNLLDLARLLARHYPPGLIIHIIADASFYATAFGNTSVEASACFNALKAEITRMGASHVLHLHDMTTLLSAEVEGFTRSYVQWRSTFERHPTTGITERDYGLWLKSMCSCMNLKKYIMEHEELRQLYTTMPDNFVQQARQALAEYRAVKAAAADLHWEERFFPGSIRATIHSKTLPVLGLRLYPQYKRRSRWLPYHGIALIQRHPRTNRHFMTVEPELFIASRPQVTRLVDEAGRTMGYVAETPAASGE